MIESDFFDQIVSSYAATALWSSYDYRPGDDDDEGIPMDENFTIDDISTETIDSFRKDIGDFLDLLNNLDGANDTPISLIDIEAVMSWSQFGHDFWLTRNGHGAGFWDRGYGEFGDVLSKWAQTFGEVNLFVNADNEIESD